MTPSVVLQKEFAEKAKVEKIYKKSSTHVEFQVPELSKGSYQLIACRRFGAALREGALDASIAVN